MLTYSMNIYVWPLSLLCDIECAIKRFIWSGDLSKSKVIIVSWKNTCTPLAEGGLSLRFLVKMNDAFNLKLAWDLVNSSDSWALLLRKRTLRKGKFIQHHIFSSLWSSLKYELNTDMDNSSRCFGNGESISLWYDNWYGDPFNLEADDLNGLIDHKVSEILVNCEWNFSKSATPIPLSIQLHIRSFHISHDLC